jgi:hypothetical protein
MKPGFHRFYPVCFIYLVFFVLAALPNLKCEISNDKC